MKKNKNSVTGFIEALENYEITPGGYLLLFLSVSFFRNFLEGLAESSRSIGTSPMFETSFFQMAVLFNLEWAALLCALCLVIAFFSAVPAVKVMRVFLASYILISIVPVLDFIIYFPGGCKIDYLYTLQDYLNALAFFFVPFKGAGVCAGIRIEVFFGFILCFLYVFIRSNSALRAVLAALSLYFLAVSSMAFPVFITLPAALLSGGADSFVSSFFSAPSYGGPLLNRIAVMIFLFLMPLLAALYGACRGTEALKNLLPGFVKPSPLILACAFAFGFLTAPLKPGLELFSSGFDYAALLSGMTIAALIGVYHDHACVDGGKDDVFDLIIILAAAASAAMNHSFLFISLFVFSASAFMRMRPFVLSRFTPAGAAFFAMCVMMMMLAGFTSVGGPFSLKYLNPFFTLSAGVIGCLFFLVKDKYKNSLLSAAMIGAFILAAFSMPRPGVLLSAPPVSLAFAYLSYSRPPSKKRSALMALLICLFFITAGLSARP